MFMHFPTAWDLRALRGAVDHEDDEAQESLNRRESGTRVDQRKCTE